jgi:hypothetical protein
LQSFDSEPVELSGADALDEALFDQTRQQTMGGRAIKP